MGISIRKYKLTDNIIIENFFNVFSDYIALLDPLKRLRRLPGYGKKYLQLTLHDIEKNNGIMYVAVMENRVIGFVVGIITKQKAIERYECIPTKTGRVTELFVQESQRGKNVGSLLMHEIEHYFKANDCNIIRIEVFEPNISAHLFYKKFGYTDRVIDLIKEIK